ncbi:MAG: SDR family NAD(P)-dependent oxidoreductase, partial [Myxococcales bacterium]|nr:SDR family NAD(P)-dependent oxidoreductase [Myxococcales bacterium]
IRQINGELSQLTTAFSQNLLKATSAAAVVVDDKARLAGLSDSDIANLAAAAKAAGKEGKYLISLLNTTQQPILASLEDRALRQQIYEASAGRAMAENGPLILRIAELRAQKAKLLGSPTWADYVLADQMAQTPQAVLKMLDDLAPKVAAKAKREAGELSTMVDVNLRAPIVLSRLVLPHLQAAGRGFIVNVASLAGKVPLDGAATYSATKFGLRAFSFAMAEELRGTGITVSAVSPGPIDTGFIMDELHEVEDIVFSQTMCTADDVARMIVDCALDGRREREFPASGGKLGTLAYLAPTLRRMIKPLLVRKGAAVKADLIARARK